MTDNQSTDQDVDFHQGKLADYLESNIDNFNGPLTAKKFTGGQSNPTYLITAQSGNYVLRRKPPGNLLKSAHAVDREFRVMQALADTAVPVPVAYHLCDDDSVIGSMFFIMGYKTGRIFWDPSLPKLNNSGRGEIYEDMNRVLASLHNVDIHAAGLADFGKPGNYFERQVGRWSKQSVERLHLIHETTQALKDQNSALGIDMIMKVAEWTPPVLLSLGSQAADGQTNSIITNVPGPQFPLYMMGAKLIEMMPVVPLLAGVGLGIALFSYDGRITWGINADYKLVPDLPIFTKMVKESFVEFADRVGVEVSGELAA